MPSPIPPRALRIALLLLIFSSAPVSASHYLIADVVDVIPAKYHKPLAKEGIRDTRALYGATVTRKARKTLAQRSSIDVRILKEWASFLDVMQIDGVGPKMVRLLRACGVKRLSVFQKANPTALHEKMRGANRGARYSEILPSAEVVRGWINRAKMLPILLE